MHDRLLLLSRPPPKQVPVPGHHVTLVAREEHFLAKAGAVGVEAHGRETAAAHLKLKLKQCYSLK
jgi:hypothetical protein